MANRFTAFIRARDWRIWLGLVVTVLWLGASAWYGLVFGPGSPGGLSLDALGSFLEGVFAPLAFLWLVLGLFIQQQELTRNTEVLRESTLHTERQTQAIAATEMNARQASFFQIAASVKRQLGGISGLLYGSAQGPLGNGTVPRETLETLFKQVSDGDFEIFARQFVGMAFAQPQALRELFYGTELRERHTRSFVDTFERLCQLARNCDVDRIIEDSLLQSAFGLLHARMLELDTRDGAGADQSCCEETPPHEHT